MKYTVSPGTVPGEGILFVNHHEKRRSGHLGHALVEYEDGKLLAFYSNCAGSRNHGHSGFGWVEYRRSEDGGETWDELDRYSPVSMNLWGFTPNMIEELKIRFPEFLESGLKTNPLKCEYFLPSVVSDLINEDKAEVKVLRSADKWYGVTYKEDKETVVAAIASMKARGDYPEKLWE